MRIAGQKPLQCRVAFAPAIGTIRFARLNWRVKAETLLVSMYSKKLGLPT